MIISRSRLLKTILLQALICFSCSSPDVKIGKEERIATINNSVFCISIVYKNHPNIKKRAFGTGFLVADNLLATAFHVKKDIEQTTMMGVRDSYQIIAWKRFENGDYLEFPIELLKFDADSDMAIYRFDAGVLKEQSKNHQVKPLVVADRLPLIGEEVLSIGYYGELDFPFNSLGNVSMINNTDDIYSDLTLMSGNSGSPLCSMRTGEVFGLNTSVMTMGDGTIRLGIAKKSAKLKELLAKVSESNPK